MSNDHDELRRRLRSSLDHRAAPELSADLVSGAAGHPTPRLTNPAKTLRIAGSAGVLVAAVTVGALVLGPTATRAPLFTAAANSGAPASGPGVANPNEANSGDAMMRMWAEYHYTADPSLSTAGASGPVYQLMLDAADPKARTASLARVLGIDGAVSRVDSADPAYPTWIVGPQDGSASNLSFSDYGTGDWWFNDPTATSYYLCDPSVSALEAASQGCMLPSEAPANRAPTGEAARSAARALFASTGYEATAADIEVSTSFDGTSASAYLTIDGIRTGLGWGAYWTNSGRLAYAYGHSVRPEARGTFGTVSPADAVQRLADYRWYGSPGPDFQNGPMMYANGSAVDDAPDGGNGSAVRTVPGIEPTTSPTAEPGSPTGTPVAEPPVEPTGEPSAEPTGVPTAEPTEPSTPAPEETLPPVDIQPSPQIIEVTVDNATATLVLMWDAKGNAWLVPGYAMKMPEGWWSAVVSLVDGVIALPKQM